MADDASRREEVKERERRRSLAAKLPMAEVTKHMDEIRLDYSLTQNEVQTCRDGMLALLFRDVYLGLDLPLPPALQVSLFLHNSHTPACHL